MSRSPSSDTILSVTADPPFFVNPPGLLTGLRLSVGGAGPDLAHALRGQRRSQAALTSSAVSVFCGCHGGLSAPLRNLGAPDS